jgi:hypothetical protein
MEANFYEIPDDSGKGANNESRGSMPTPISGHAEKVKTGMQEQIDKLLKSAEELQLQDSSLQEKGEAVEEDIATVLENNEPRFSGMPKRLREDGQGETLDLG